MAIEPKTIAYERLHSDEVQNLPSRVMASLGKASTEGEGDQWVVIRSSLPPDMVDQLSRLDKFIEAWAEGNNLDRALAQLVDTGEQIHHVSSLLSRNKSEPASRWKKEDKTFAVREDGAPRPVVRDVLAALPDTMTAWQKALWFASGSGWLDGDEPQRRLNDGER